jgi:hypothetical protein
MKMTIKDGLICCSSDTKSLWQMHISNVKLIGEYTTSAGPFLDDYFFIFAESEDKWFEVSNDAISGSDFLDRLGELLHVKISLGLANSAEWRSRVLYPESLIGQTLFKPLVQMERPRKLFGSTIGTKTEEGGVEITENVRSCLST